MTIFSQILRGVALTLALTVFGGAAQAQQSPGLLDNLFTRGNSSQQQDATTPESAADLSVRIDRLEGQIRQLTGAIEQLQFRNQQLEQQLARGQGGAAIVSSPVVPNAAPGAMTAEPLSPAAGAPPPALNGGRRSDAFDPARSPNAPGVPRALGGSASAIATAPVQDDTPVGAPGGRAAGAPLDLSTLAGGTAGAPPVAAAPLGNQALPPPPPRNPSATGTQLATLPPSHSPKDEYDLAYGYVLHKDYALAEQAFKDFLRKNANDRLAPEANYWLGESFFQRQRYQDAADSYLVVVRNYERSDKAAEALLRLGQSLAALGQKEMACASLGEVARKYPQSPPSVKRSATTEQKRVHC